MISLKQVFNGPEIFGYSGFRADYDILELREAIEMKGVKILEHKVSGNRELWKKQLSQHPMDIHHECGDNHILIPILGKYTNGWKYSYFFGGVKDGYCDIEIYEKNNRYIEVITAIEVGWTKASRVIRNFMENEKLETFVVVPFILGTKQLSPIYYEFTRNFNWSRFVELRLNESKKIYDKCMGSKE